MVSLHPRQGPAEPSPGPGVQACGKFFGAQAQGHGLGRAWIRVGVQGEQRTPPVEIELSKPCPIGAWSTRMTAKRIE